MIRGVEGPAVVTPPAIRDAGDRGEIDDTKTRTSGEKTLSGCKNCPTQAKTGLEWATRPGTPSFAVQDKLLDWEPRLGYSAVRPLSTDRGVGNEASDALP
jgi:hypothetical protein